MATSDKIRILSKITSFTDVTKSLQEIEKVLNNLVETIKTPAEKELKETEGSTGDIQITQNKDKSYTFEVKTRDGWKTPVIGNSAVKFADKPATLSKKQNKSIDEIEADDTSTGGKDAEKTIFDEKANKFVLPRPDYDSGLISVADGQTTGTHNIGSIPIHNQIWWSDDNGVTMHKLFSSSDNSFSLELTSTEWQITGATTYGSACLTSTNLTSVDYTGWKLKVLLWK